MIGYLLQHWHHYLGACLLTGLILNLISPAATKAGLVDQPDARKTHSRPVPLIGGIGIILSFGLSLMIFNTGFSEFRVLLFCLICLLLLGALDDYVDVRPISKLLGQVLIAVALVWGGEFYVTNFGAIIKDDEIVVGVTVGRVITVLAIVAVINAYNMIDGLDGLIGSIMLTSLGALLALYFKSPHTYLLSNICEQSN